MAENQTQTFKEIELKVKPIEIKDGDTTKKFNSYKALQKNGKYIDCRFVMGCKNVPSEDCIIKVDVSEINIDKNRKYPILWVKNVIEILPTSTPEVNIKELDDLF